MTNLTTHVSAKDRNETPMDTCPVSMHSSSMDRSEWPDRPDRPDTPTVLCAGGIRLPHDQSPINLSNLRDLLKIDMNSDSDTFLDDIYDLLDENKGIFPNSKLPFPPTEELLHGLSLYDSESEKWKLPEMPRPEVNQGEKKPKQPTAEKYIAEFLNKICTDMAKRQNVSQIRDWNASFCNSQLEGSPINRKPDIILVDIQSRCAITWTSVRAITEVTSQEKEPKRMSTTVTDKSYVILTTQPDRVFVPILSFWSTSNNFCVRLTVTDRQGQLRSQSLKIGSPWRQGDSLNFLRLLIGLCFTPKPAVGYDPTMETNESNELVSIVCDGKKFNVIDTIFESQSLVGRATRVWEVEFEKKRYILKDAWVEVSRPVPEYEILKGMKGMKGVPQFYCGGNVVSSDGKSISTAVLRPSYGDSKRFRVRRRTVTSTIGAHIATFSSKRELISVLRDIVITLRKLSEEKDLIHRDISYNNILILDSEDGNPQECRSGLLIDFEYATTQSQSRPMAPGSRTGTAPFMAIELLMNKSKIRHSSHHDLESLFFVLIYICTNLSGPCLIRTREELMMFSSIPLSAWFRTSFSLRDVGIAKAIAFCLFEENILKPFAPYFENLKPCVVRIFKEMYGDAPGNPKPITHDKMIEIFTETLDTLPHETISNPSFQSLSVTSSPRVRKISLGIHDKSLGPIQKKMKSISREANAPQGSSSNWMVVSGDNATVSSGARGSGSPTNTTVTATRGSGNRRSGRSGGSVSRPL